MLGPSPLEQRVPWLPFTIAAALANTIDDGWRVAEFGGGGSTVWFADRGAIVTTIEHDGAWADAVRSVAPPSVTIHFRPIDESPEPYVHALDDEPDGSFDLVLIDGEARLDCITASLPKLKGGGLLVVDDTNTEIGPPVMAMLRDWSRRDFCGLAPSKAVPGQTSCWTKPAATTPP
jgi:predicted O-methyltransferase YrrM